MILQECANGLNPEMPSSDFNKALGT